jgi:hypothetical protein
MREEVHAEDYNAGNRQGQGRRIEGKRGTTKTKRNDYKRSSPAEVSFGVEDEEAGGVGMETGFDELKGPEFANAEDMLESVSIAGLTTRATCGGGHERTPFVA